jgi:hypothetical protein
MNREEEMNQRYQRAKKRTDQLRKFYKHLVTYIIVNLFISGYKILEYMDRGDSFEEAFLNLDTFIVWIVWGAFVALQAVRTFKPGIVMGADWEERKIREIMNDNKR